MAVVKNKWLQMDDHTHRCECGTVHGYEFRVVKGRVQVRINQNKRATAQSMRRLREKDVQAR